MSNCYICNGMHGKCKLEFLKEASEEDIEWIEFGINVFKDEEAKVGRNWQSTNVALFNLARTPKDISGKRYLATTFICKRCLLLYMSLMPDYCGTFKRMFGKYKKEVMAID